MLLVWLVILSLVLAAAVCLLTGAFAAFSWCWALPLYTLGFFLLLVLAVFLYLLYLCHRVDQSVPQEEIDPHYKKVLDLLLESALPLLRIRIKTEGLEKMPREGRFLLVCNHCNDSDPVMLMRVLGKYDLAFVSKKENSDMFIVGPMMHKLMCQLINRENDREALKTILKCIQIIKEDKASIAVFPEGGILTKDGKLHHFKPGVFKIAQKANVPVVVCVMKNTKDVIHNLLRFKGSRVELKVLEVIDAQTAREKKTVDIAQYCHDLMAAELGPGMVAD